MGAWSNRVNTMLLLAVPASAALAAGGQGVSVGASSRVFASVQAGVESNDNLYLTENNAVEAVGLRLRPSLTLVLQPSSGEYQFGYKGDAAALDTSDEDDYFDQHLFAIGKFRPLTRHELSYQVNFRDSHDPFGQDRNQGVGFVANRELDKWRQFDGKVEYVFGGQEATLNWKLRGELLGKTYHTNETDPLNPATGTRFLDRTEAGGGTGLSWKIGPDTRLLADLDTREIDYDSDLTPSLDGDLITLLVGVGWQATAKTSGEVRIGQYQRNFDDSARRDGDGLAWSAKITWAPQTYTAFSFETGQLATESVLLAENFIDYRYVAAGWQQGWTSRLTTNLRLALNEAEFEGAGRDDSGYSLSGLLGYKFSDRYSLEFNADFSDRDSNLNGFDFERTLVGLSLKAQL